MVSVESKTALRSRLLDTSEDGSWAAWGRTAVRIAAGAFTVTAIVGLLGFPREPAAWAVVSLGVVLGDTTGQSVGASWNRIQGSIVGVICGATTVLLLGSIPTPLQVVTAMLLCLAVCRILRVGAGVRLGLGLSGFFVFVPGTDQLETAGYRLVATALGIGVALLMTVVLWPDTARRRLRVTLGSLSVKGAQVLAADVARWGSGQGTSDPNRAANTAEPHAPNPPDLGELKTLSQQAHTLQGDIRHELSHRGITRTQLTGTATALTTATSAISRLHTATLYPNELASHIEGDLLRVADHYQGLASALAHTLTGPASEAPARQEALRESARGLRDAEATIAEALADMRARQATIHTDSAVLLQFFDVLTALSHACRGLLTAAAAGAGGFQVAVETTGH